MILNNNFFIICFNSAGSVHADEGVFYSFHHMPMEVWPKAIGPLRVVILNYYLPLFVLTALVVSMQMRACLTAYII